MKKLTIALFTLMTLLSTSVSAAPIDISPGTTFLFSELYQTSDAPVNVGDELAGFGSIATVRNADTSLAFQSSPAAELTYEYGGFNYLGTEDGFFEFDAGWMNVFYDTTPDFNPRNGDGYSDGTLFLDLVSHTVSGVGLEALVLGDLFSLGGGFFDVGNGGGVANSLLDTNGVFISADGSYADFDFTYSNSRVQSELLAAEFSGTGDLRGAARSVPEPATLLMVLLGLVFLYRRIPDGDWGDRKYDPTWIRKMFDVRPQEQDYGTITA